MTKYYFPDSCIDRYMIYGEHSPVCLDAAEVERLARDFQIPEMMDYFHAANLYELIRYGVNRCSA